MRGGALDTASLVRRTRGVLGTPVNVEGVELLEGERRDASASSHLGRDAAAADTNASAARAAPAADRGGPDPGPAPARPVRFVPRTVAAALRLRGVQALVVCAALLVATAFLAARGDARRYVLASLGFLLAVVLHAVYCQPRYATALASAYEPRIHWRVPGGGGGGPPVAALTIDDVPFYGTSRLREILEILEENGARATLFVMSGTCAPETAELLRGAVHRGTVELGNHGAYDEPAIGLSAADFDAKHAACERLLESIQGETHRKWLRPGSGLASLGGVVQGFFNVESFRERERFGEALGTPRRCRRAGPRRS